MPPTPLEREIEIGLRLRAFREMKRIHRTAFALSIGIGNERLASYEAGRVPLRAEVFAAIHRQYFINPVWLATGEGEPAMDGPAMLWPSDNLEAGKGKFSALYDRLAAFLSDPAWKIEESIRRLRKSAGELSGHLKAHPGARIDSALAQSLLRENTALLREVREVARAAGKRALSPARDDIHGRVKQTNDKSPVAALLVRLKAATAKRGKKSELAAYLKVPPAAVSQWLTEDREPGGETALRLLAWVAAEEAKQKRPG